MVLALDGSVQAAHSAGVITLALTTAIANDVIIVGVHTQHKLAYSTVSSVTAAGVTFAKRQSVAQIDGEGGTYFDDEEWYTTWTSSGLLTITVTLSVTPFYRAFGVAFGISGADTTTIFDSNAGANPTGTGWTTDPHVHITTSNANDFIFGLLGTNASTAPTVGAGYTQIQLAGFTSSEYMVVSATQAGTTVNFTLAKAAWSMIADAVIQGTAAGGAAQAKRRLLMGVGLQADVWNINKYKLKLPRLSLKTV